MNERSGNGQPADVQFAKALTHLGIAGPDAALYLRLRRVALTMMQRSDMTDQQLGEGLSDVAEAWLNDLYSGGAADEDRRTLFRYLRQYDDLSDSADPVG